MTMLFSSGECRLRASDSIICFVPYGSCSGFIASETPSE
jgi:hypothetical protein